MDGTTQRFSSFGRISPATHLEALVLEYFLYRYILSRFHESRLKDDTKGAVPDDLWHTQLQKIAQATTPVQDMRNGQHGSEHSGNHPMALITLRRPIFTQMCCAAVWCGAQAAPRSPSPSFEEAQQHTPGVTAHSPLRRGSGAKNTQPLHGNAAWPTGGTAPSHW